MNATLAPDTLDWDTIFRNYHQNIFNFVRSRVCRPGTSDELAEDLTMDVFTRAIEADKHGNGPHSHLGGWLFGIARNLLTDYYRALGRRPAITSFESIVHEDGMVLHDVVELSITRQQVRRALGSLTCDQSAVIDRRMDGYQFHEIAADLGKSCEAVKQLRNRAFAQLHKRLEGVNVP